MAQGHVTLYLNHVFRLSNYRRRPELADGSVTKSGRSKRLIVFVHGWIAGQPAKRVMTEFLKDANEEELKDCDLLAPLYPDTVFANTDPYYLAAEIQRLISDAWDERKGRDDRQPYESVVLIGVSAGALIVRKALLFARGQGADHPFPDRTHNAEWLDKVTRVVLLAGMNRGWSLAVRPKQMPMLRYACYRAVRLLGGIPFWGRFIIALERGAPFVSDLRVQWLRELDAERRLPLVVQVLGEIDDLVTSEDNKDVEVSQNFVFVSVRGTGHANVLDFSDPEYGELRRLVLIEALTQPTQRLLKDHPPKTRTVAPETTDIVFLMHGNSRQSRLDEQIGRDNPQEECCVSL